MQPFSSDLMAAALTHAAQALTLSSPNPRVGCVIADTNGTVLGQGHTQAVGGPHAEVMALRDAQQRGNAVHGATAYVTLEPCSHQGRTGPCCDALVAAGIRSVVAAIADPNPRVCGQGFARLRAAGVQVQVLPADDPHAQAARELNLGFFSRMVRKTPWLRMKVAASLDGKTALPNGASQWITGAPARTDGHAWRARACAVLTGIGTVLHDQPRLDVRLVPTQRQPHLAVVDSSLQIPLDAPLFGIARKLWIYTAQPPSQAQTPAHIEKIAALQARGAEVINLPAAQASQPGADGADGADGALRVDLVALLRDLAQREVNELHVEAGHTLNGALLQAGVLDELLAYIAPCMLGQGVGMAQFGPLARLSDAVPLAFQSTHMLGQDLRILARVVGRDIF